jgi:hypothetical protein
VNLFGWFDKTGDSFLAPLCPAVVCSYQLNDGFVGARSENACSVLAGYARPKFSIGHVRHGGHHESGHDRIS